VTNGNHQPSQAPATAGCAWRPNKSCRDQTINQTNQTSRSRTYAAPSPTRCAQARVHSRPGRVAVVEEASPGCFETCTGDTQHTLSHTSSRSWHPLMPFSHPHIMVTPDVSDFHPCSSCVNTPVPHTASCPFATGTACEQHKRTDRLQAAYTKTDQPLNRSCPAREAGATHMIGVTPAPVHLQSHLDHSAHCSSLRGLPTAHKLIGSPLAPIPQLKVGSDCSACVAHTHATTCSRPSRHMLCQLCHNTEARFMSSPRHAQVVCGAGTRAYTLTAGNNRRRLRPA
jgi:hypothetical protein